MARGRKPTPTPILKARGSRRAKDRPEPSGTAGRPVLPDWSRPEVGPLFEQVVEILEPTGILTGQDWVAVWLFVEALWNYLQACRAAEERPIAATTAAGNPKADPARAAMLVWWQATLKAAAEIGLTPRARDALPAAPVIEDPRIAKYLKLRS